MTYYKELSKLTIFSILDVENLVNNRKTAYSLISRMMNKGLVVKIRSNMYSCVNIRTGEIMANKFEIACATSSSAYISKFNALEYHGLIGQCYKEVSVFSNTRFRDYEYKGVKYKYILSRNDLGIIEPCKSSMIRVTNIERTLIDIIRDINKIEDVDLFIDVIFKIEELNVKGLIEYLEEYNTQSLFQKTGFLFEKFLKKIDLPSEFYEYCKKSIKKSTTYLNDESKINGKYIKEWRLIVPKEFQ